MDEKCLVSLGKLSWCNTPCMAAYAPELTVLQTGTSIYLSHIPETPVHIPETPVHIPCHLDSTSPKSPAHMCSVALLLFLPDLPPSVEQQCGAAKRFAMASR